MNEYTAFAEVYDALMGDIAHTDWARYVAGTLARGGVQTGALVLDLACGTGGMTLPLTAAGYEMIGVDLSEDMLAQAAGKMPSVLFLRQDMRGLDLFGTVDAAVCACDGLNYMLCEEDLAEVFRRVRLFLAPGGIFIFDMATEYKYKHALGNRVFAEEAHGAACEWENVYDDAKAVNEYRLWVRNPQGETAHEVHRQRAYCPLRVREILLAGGFESVSIQNAYTDEPLHGESMRAVFIAYG
jgi:SAM-dependent methyltransferase